MRLNRRNFVKKSTISAAAAAAASSPFSPLLVENADAASVSALAGLLNIDQKNS